MRIKFFFFILQLIIKDYLIRIIHLRIVGIIETEGIIFPKLFIEGGSENLIFSVIIALILKVAGKSREQVTPVLLSEPAR